MYRPMRSSVLPTDQQPTADEVWSEMLLSTAQIRHRRWICWERGEYCFSSGSKADNDGERWRPLVSCCECDGVVE